MKEMKTLTLGGNLYEIVDNTARVQLSEIIKKIQEIESDLIDTEVIKSTVADYLDENPIESLTIDEIVTYIQTHIDELGLKGDTGVDGASAYEIAVSNGFDGTESQWLESLKGEDGANGTTPTISATASVDNTTGTPSVNITKTGTDASPIFNFTFSGLKGETGDGSSSETTTSPLYDTSGFSKSSIDIMHEMKWGYNIGNQFDACARGTTIPSDEIDRVSMLETFWGNPKVSKSYIKYLADIGFTCIRLPITWYDNIDTYSNTISISRLNRIKEIVDEIINNGMYCIINVHHDGHKKNRKIYFDDDYKNVSMAYFSNLWKQIGEYFKDYGYKLLFEPYNECTNSANSMTADSTKEAIAVDYANTFLDIIRKQDGNNSNRFCIIPNYAGVSFMSADSFQNINDSATDKLLLTAHSYPTGSNANDIFTTANSRVTNLGIGCVIDEIGCMPADKYDLAFVQSIHDNADSKNIAFCWWDNGQREFNLVDRYHICPSNLALGVLLGKELNVKELDISNLSTDLQPYYAIFYTKDAVSNNNVYNTKLYMAITSSASITSVNTLGKTNGYYGLTMPIGTYFSVYVSDDNITYTLIESGIYTETAKTVISKECYLWGSTEETYYYDGNYTITDAPTELIHCTNIIIDDSLSVTENGILSYTIEPSNCTDTISFSSSDISVLRVNSNGQYSIVSGGNVEITVTCGDIIKTISVTTTLDNPDVTYSLPASQDVATMGATNSSIVNYKFFDEDTTNENAIYHYWSIVHDLTNDRYILMYSSLPINRIYISTVVRYGNTSDMSFITMISNTSAFLDFYEYYNNDSDCMLIDGVPNIDKKRVASSGKYYYFNADTDNNIVALTSLDEIEVIAANHTIEGYYTLT